MTTTVYVWRMFQGTEVEWSESKGQPLRSRLSGSIGGFGHVALKVRDTYMSYWPGEYAGEAQSCSWSYEEDEESCHRRADREIVIHRLAEDKMIKEWNRCKDLSFRNVGNNCCRVTINILAVGANGADLKTTCRAIGRAILDPIESIGAALEHDIREFLYQGVHDPNQVEKFAEQLRYLF